VTRLLCAALLAATVLAGCGGDSGVSAGAPACPARLPARSTVAPGHAGPLTGPGRLCVYARSRLARQLRVSAAPLRRVLATPPRRRPSGIACAAVARLPSALVARRAVVVLEMSGCPAAVLPNGTPATLASGPAGTLSRWYAAARPVP
jgi:hypothetical protein